MEKRMNLTCYYNTFKLINAGLIAVVPAVTRVRFLTLLHLFPKSNFVIRHNFTCTSSTAFLAVNVVNFRSVKQADVYLTDLLNTIAA